MAQNRRDMRRLSTAASRRLAWIIGSISILLEVAQVVILFVDRNAVVPKGSTVWGLAAVVSAVSNAAVPAVGIVLASKRPENPIGWLFITAGAGLGLQDFCTAYAHHALIVHPGAWPAGFFVAWISNWVWTIPAAMLVFLLLLFPTGSLPSPRWRPFARVLAGGFAIQTAAALVAATASWSEPIATGPSASDLGVYAGAFLIAAVLTPVGVVAGFVAVVVRFRRSEGQERLQLKWFVTAAAIVAVVFPVAMFANSHLGTILNSLALLFLYAAIGIAVLKYRLYEIDVVINRAVVFGSLVVFISLVYVAFVVGVGAFVGSNAKPVLAALAAAFVALAFQPVRRRARHFANRVVYGRRATPYEVMSEFAERIAGSYASEDVLPEMARIIAAGTGAERTVVWLRVGGELRAVASSKDLPSATTVPFDGELSPTAFGGETVVPVAHGGEALGAISVRMPKHEPLGDAGERLVAHVASQAGLVLSNARLIEELRASRQRLVAAQDAARRRLERNIHDGAQQQLVALAVKQRLAAALITKDPGRAAAMLESLQADTNDALETLRDLARGIYPPLLADQGLAAALIAQARKAAVPAEVDADGLGRYPQEVEAAVYFCCLEAMQNVAKYAGASHVTVRLSAPDGVVAFAVTDDGAGFDTDRTPLGSGLQNMADRLAALGGSVEIRSRPGAGTTVAGRVPVALAH
jgi:signal transduction histidine kinase